MNKIHIKPENVGKFTRYAERKGQSVQEAASNILANKESYPPTLVKRANFAHNAAGWNKYNNGGQVPLISAADEKKSVFPSMKPIEQLVRENKVFEGGEFPELTIQGEKIQYYPNEYISDAAKMNFRSSRKKVLDIIESEGYRNKLKNELIESSGVSDEKLIEKETSNLQSNRYENVSKIPFAGWDSEIAHVDAKIVEKEKNGEKYISPVGLEYRANFQNMMGGMEGKTFQNLVGAEEFEHASHIDMQKDKRMNRNDPFLFYGEKNDARNITPYAKKIIEENTAKKEEYENGFEGSVGYLRDPTEVIAKKRSIEIFLIDNGFLSPGGEVNEKQMNFVLDEIEKNPKMHLPMKHFFESLIGKEIGNEKNTNPFHSQNPKGKENRDRIKQRFLNIMNKIAATENNEPMQTARFGLKVQKGAYGMQVQEPPPTPFSFNMGKVQGMLPGGFYGNPLASQDLSLQDMYDLGLHKDKYTEQQYGQEMPDIENRPLYLSQGVPTRFAANAQKQPFAFPSPNLNMVPQQGAPQFVPMDMDYPANAVANPNYTDQQQYGITINPNDGTPMVVPTTQQTTPADPNGIPYQAAQNQDYIAQMPGFEWMNNMPQTIPQQNNIVNPITAQPIPNDTPLTASLMNVPPIQSASVNTPQTTQPAEAQDKRFDPSGYFDLIKTIDLGQLGRNMMQGPPPTLQNPITHLNRVHYDRGMFDSAKQQAKEANLRGLYEAQQQLGQAGDYQQLATAYSAQNMQTQQGIGQQERALQQQEIMQNVGIQHQEQQMQDQQNLQETQQNYQIQAAAQAAKDAAIQHQLGAIKHDVQLETQYGVQKDVADRQEAIDKKYKAAQEALGLMSVDMQMEDKWRNTPEYIGGRQKFLTNAATEAEKKAFEALYADPAVKAELEAAGVSSLDLTDYNNIQSEIQNMQSQYMDMGTKLDEEKMLVESQKQKVEQLKNIDTKGMSEVELQNHNQSLQEAEANAKTFQANVDRYDKDMAEIKKKYGTSSAKMSAYDKVRAKFDENFDPKALDAEYDVQARKESSIWKKRAELAKILGIE